jgi:hypothetical protein
VLVLGELVEDVGGRRDRVRAEQHRELGELAGGDETPRQGGVAGHRGVLAARQLGRADLVAVTDLLGRLAEVQPGLEGGRVGVSPSRSCEAGDPPERGDGLGVHERHEAEREELSLSRGLTPSGTQASFVREVIGTVITR